VIESSLNMVRELAAYVGVISLKYGQTPFDSGSKSGSTSITELEFNEAMQLDRPIVLFVMAMNRRRGVGRHRPPPTAYIAKPCRWLDFVSPIRAILAAQASERRMTWRRVPARALPEAGSFK